MVALQAQLDLLALKAKVLILKVLLPQLVIYHHLAINPVIHILLLLMDIYIHGLVLYGLMMVLLLALQVLLAQQVPQEPHQL
jgi:hypothetical protein